MALGDALALLFVDGEARRTVGVCPGALTLARVPVELEAMGTKNVGALASALILVELPWREAAVKTALTGALVLIEVPGLFALLVALTLASVWVLHQREVTLVLAVALASVRIELLVRRALFIAHAEAPLFVEGLRKDAVPRVVTGHTFA